MNGFACFLPDEAMIHLRGSKIPEFLQGQLTCDTRKLSMDKGVMGALCSVKGRVLSDLTIVQVSDSHVVLRLRRSLATVIADTLRRYAQFSRISVEADLSEKAILGVLTSPEVAPSSADPDDLMAVSPKDGGLFLQRGAYYGELLYMDESNTRALASHDEFAAESNRQKWAAAMLRSGHFAIDLEDFESFTPQALNYDLRGLVAFDKGCYTGQEIVARLHYKGRSKKRLQILRTSASSAGVDRDAPLHNVDGDIVGRCLREVSVPAADTLVAAEVNREYLNQDLYLSNRDALHCLDFDYGEEP